MIAPPRARVKLFSSEECRIWPISAPNRLPACIQPGICHKFRRISFTQGAQVAGKGRDDRKTRDAHELAALDGDSLLQKAIGRQIRKIRLGKNLTVSDLSRASSVSVAMISKIENGQTSASLGTLQRISGALAIPLSSLFIQFEELSNISYVKAGDGLEIERRGTRAGHHYRLLGHGVRAEVAVEPYLVTLTDESDVFPWFQHGGVEFIYMLEGEMEYRHGNEVYTLAPGDSLFFDPQAIHGPDHLKRFPIRFLTVISYADKL
ncbi:MAG TPA: XRE family transcriptional regulator [Rhodobacteraceae bacterium]|nr:XRE family transcriptional regulator [Paracoccaceae bacterium]